MEDMIGVLLSLRLERGVVDLVFFLKFYDLNACYFNYGLGECNVAEPFIGTAIYEEVGGSSGHVPGRVIRQKGTIV